MKEKIKKKTSKLLSGFATILYFLIGIIIVSSYSAMREGQREKQREKQYYENIEIEQKAEWEYFNSTIGQFKILFPVYPKHTTHYLDVGKLDVYIAEQSDGTTYLAEVGEYSVKVDMSDVGTFLKKRLEAALLLLEGNELVSSNFTNFGAYKALDFSIRNKEYNIVSNGRMMVIEKKFYGLISSSSKENEYSKFINSFQLTK